MGGGSICRLLDCLSTTANQPRQQTVGCRRAPRVSRLLSLVFRPVSPSTSLFGPPHTASGKTRTRTTAARSRPRTENHTHTKIRQNYKQSTDRSSRIGQQNTKYRHSSAQRRRHMKWGWGEGWARLVSMHRRRVDTATPVWYQNPSQKPPTGGGREKDTRAHAKTATKPKRYAHEQAPRRVQQARRPSASSPSLQPTRQSKTALMRHTCSAWKILNTPRWHATIGFRYS